MTLIEFHSVLGETIMFCQIIENDVKWIYSFMRKGEVEDNYGNIDGRTLGQALKELKELDCSDGKPYISLNDYNFLSQMIKKRNYWCHEAYIDFIYDENFQNSKEYQKVCNMLLHDNEKLSKVYRAVEQVKLKARKDYNR